MKKKVASLLTISLLVVFCACAAREPAPAPTSINALKIKGE